MTNLTEQLDHFINTGCIMDVDGNIGQTGDYCFSDWYCKDTELEDMAIKLMTITHEIITNVNLIDPSTVYVWFRNCSNDKGVKYNEIKLSDINKDQTIFVIVPETPSGHSELWTGVNDFKFPFLSGDCIRDLFEKFNDEVRKPKQGFGSPEDLAVERTLMGQVGLNSNPPGIGKHVDFSIRAIPIPEQWYVNIDKPEYVNAAKRWLQNEHNIDAMSNQLLNTRLYCHGHFYKIGGPINTQPNVNFVGITFDRFFDQVYLPSMEKAQEDTFVLPQNWFVMVNNDNKRQLYFWYLQQPDHNTFINGEDDLQDYFVSNSLYDDTYMYWGQNRISGNPDILNLDFGDTGDTNMIYHRITTEQFMNYVYNTI